MWLIAVRRDTIEEEEEYIRFEPDRCDRISRFRKIYRDTVGGRGLKCRCYATNTHTTVHTQTHYKSNDYYTKTLKCNCNVYVKPNLNINNEGD